MKVKNTDTNEVGRITKDEDGFITILWETGVDEPSHHKQVIRKTVAPAFIEIDCEKCDGMGWLSGGYYGLCKVCFGTGKEAE